MSSGWRRLLRWGSAPRPVPDALWEATLADYGFLRELTATEQRRLRELTGSFLDEKEFHGAGGLQITDAMAVAIAAQACLPLLHLTTRPDGRPLGRGSSPLVWYRDFVGIVVQPDEVVARREVMDDAGVVHAYDEILSGEAMERGPVMLSWRAVASAGESAGVGYNVVVHEFAHKLDMADGAPDGCPPLPVGFMGTTDARDARTRWMRTWQDAHAAFCDQVVIAERFGGAMPWLDAYGTHSLEEFFAVACEAYFVNRRRFSAEWPALLPLLDAFFQPDRSLAP
ncbi:zinc-dependent peptidase [Pseudorhodoferax sp.]|uniref:M90 family metallopeptidase n=1 Tax=Pseudorhodoferax sp. TaxID=1993553 RepID=UPI0039E5612A